ncbi:MAG: hypothetical protein ABL962_19185 [Fimbriimonadaceae bacterium]
MKIGGDAQNIVARPSILWVQRIWPRQFNALRVEAEMDVEFRAVERQRDYHNTFVGDIANDVHSVMGQTSVNWYWKPKHTITADVKYSCVARFTVGDVARLFVEAFSDIETGETLRLIEEARSARQRALDLIQKEQEDLYGTDGAD